MQQPRRVVLDGANNAYVLDTGSAQIVQVDPQGNGRVFATGLSGGVGDLTIDPDNNLYYAASNDVWQITPSGGLNPLGLLFGTASQSNSTRCRRSTRAA